MARESEYVELRPAKEVTTRKPHHCEWCGEEILTGERVISRAYIYGNGPQSRWQHQECYDAMYEIASDLYDGWTFGIFHRGTTEAG